MRHDRIIDALGGNVAVGEEIGRDQSTVSRWRREGIPPQYWLALIQMGKRHDPAVELELLDLHLGLPVDSRFRPRTKGYSLGPVT